MGPLSVSASSVAAAYLTMTMTLTATATAMWKPMTANSGGVDTARRGYSYARVGPTDRRLF